MTLHNFFFGALPFTLLLLTSCAFTQKSGLESITEEELREHLTYLASDELQGRRTGEPGLDLAADYLSDQARKIGLKPVDENGDYFQEYTLVYRNLDFPNCSMTIRNKDGSRITCNDRFYLMNSDADTMDISGEVLFAGYGIQSAEDGYDDLAGLELKNKIVIIMDGAPHNGDGKMILRDRKWSGTRSFRHKIPLIAKYEPRAIIIVPAPSSGLRSMDQRSRSITRYISSSRFVEELGNKRLPSFSEHVPPLIFGSREVFDEMIQDPGISLEKLQDKISRTEQTVSYQFNDVQLSIHAAYRSTRKSVPNVVGLIEGSDPQLKDELIIYSAHFDHLGVSLGDEVYNGADDNASGTVALLELAEAFMKEKKNLKRSVLILWVSGEEIGLYGSEFYSEYPLLPLENTLADINLDMVGAVRTERDTGYIYREEVQVMGMDSIQLIGGHQSSDLMDIHNRITDEMGMITDLSKSSPDHPYRYYFRSDHFNFVKHDVPILFYSTGTHVDYHKTSDDITRISFPKLKKVTELSFRVGYELVTMPGRIIIDNPYSKWEGSNYR